MKLPSKPIILGGILAIAIATRINPVKSSLNSLFTQNPKWKELVDETIKILELEDGSDERVGRTDVNYNGGSLLSENSLTVTIHADDLPLWSSSFTNFKDIGANGSLDDAYVFDPTNGIDRDLPIDDSTQKAYEDALSWILNKIQ